MSKYQKIINIIYLVDFSAVYAELAVLRHTVYRLFSAHVQWKYCTV